MQIAHNPLEGPRPELVLDLKKDTSEGFVSIIIVHNDKPEYLNITLQSILVNSVNNNFEIIVVDNGSGKESQDFLNEIEDQVKVIRNPKNLHWAEAANKGVAAADKNSKYLLFMHHDVVILNPAWLDLLTSVCESQKAGLVGVEMGSYQIGREKVEFVQECCIMFTKESFKEIGPWPEQLPQIGGAFIMTVRARNKGYKVQVMKNQIIHHYKTFSIDISDFERLSEKAMITLPQMIRDVQSVGI